MYVLARRRLVWGTTAWWVLLTFVSMPTLFFFACELALPSGAATYLNGPLSYLYFVWIVVTGCTFRFRLAVASGLVAALGSGIAVAFAVPHLADLRHPDTVRADDLSAPPIYVFKALMMVAAAFATGALSLIAKRLTLRGHRHPRRARGARIDRQLGSQGLHGHRRPGERRRASRTSPRTMAIRSSSRAWCSIAFPTS